MSQKIDSLTRAGLPGVDKIPWGSHFCQFYRDRQDLIGSLVPYFKAGLDNNEKCIWLTADPLPAAAAGTAFGAAVPRWKDKVKSGQLDIAGHKGHALFAGGLKAFFDAEERALAEGYLGLRLAGNTASHTAKDWAPLIKFEETLDHAFAKRRIVVLCSYTYANLKPTDIFQVVRHHRFTLQLDDGHWAVSQP